MQEKYFFILWFRFGMRYKYINEIKWTFSSIIIISNEQHHYSFIHYVFECFFFLQGIHELDPTHRRTASHAYHSAE